MKILTVLILLFSFHALAEDFLSEPETEAPEFNQDEEFGRGPASLPPVPSRRTYPGGADEEDLRVQNILPEAPIKTDARLVQKEVYKNLFNRELKDERSDLVEE